MKNSLLIRLSVILTALFGLSMWLHFILEIDGLFINLATELVGIIISLILFELILRNHEERKWEPTNQRVKAKLRILLNEIISDIRRGFDISIDVFDQLIRESKNSDLIHQEIIRVAEQIIAPTALSRIEKLDKKDWKQFDAMLNNSYTRVDNFFDRFQTRLSPNQISLILDLQDALAHSRIFYSTFPELAGTTKNELPATNTPPEILQSSGYRSTAKEIQRVCNLSVKLSRQSS